LPLGFGDQGTDRFFIAHISKDGVRASTFGCDLGGDWSAILGVGQHDLGAFGRQRLGEDRAERGLRARCRTGDDRNLSVQTGHWNFSSRRVKLSKAKPTMGR
jgi:hypothetical protein